MGDHNPWLDVTAEDYLGHMGSEAVGQLPVLADLFGEALAHFAPRRLLVLGCGTGNGFDRIDPEVTRRVTGVEINPAYLEILGAEWPSPPFELDLICGDASAVPIAEGTYDLICAALIFEYVAWRDLVPKVARGVAEGGGCAVVLQLPSPTAPPVSRSDYPGVRVLEPLFRFVDPAELKRAFGSSGLRLERERELPLPQGKAFGAYRFRRTARCPSG